MVRVVGVILEEQGLLLDDGVALLADVFAQTTRLLAVMARATQVSEEERDEGMEGGMEGKDGASTYRYISGDP